MKKIALTVALAFLSVLFANAQQPVVITDSVKIHFHCARTEFDPNLSGNGEVLRGILERLKDDGRDSLLTYQGVEFIGGASPEGSVKLNESLSYNRAQRLFSKLEEFRALPDSMRTFTYLGRDWKGLLERVKADPDVPSRDKVIDLVTRIIADNPPVANPVEKLKRMDGGRPYAYMLANIFPALRAASMRITYKLVPRYQVKREYPDANLLTAAPAPQIISRDFERTIIEDEPEAAPCSPFYMDFRTNMLYDVALLPTLGVDFYLGKNLSIGANWTYAWWSKNSKHRYWRAYGGDINLQWFLGEKAKEKPLQGHHIGIYGQILTYDFEFHGTGWMGGKPGGDLWDKMHWGVGLNYGYSLPVGRRLNIDFSLGLGYMTGTYYTYKPIDGCYVWQSTKTRHYFGPTKAEVSLVWLIGCGNYNVKKQKGGAE